MVRSNLLSGIQHFAREMILGLSRKNLDFQLIRFRDGHFYKLDNSLEELKNIGKFKNELMESVELLPNEHNCLVILDLETDIEYLQCLDKYLELSKVVFYVHDVLPLTHKLFFPENFIRDFENYIERVAKSRNIISSCHYTLNEILYVIDRISPINRSNSVIEIPPVSFEECTHWTDGGPEDYSDYLLMVSNYEPRKNHSGLFRAMELVFPQIDSPLDVILVGSYDRADDKLDKEIESFRLSLPKSSRLRLFKNLPTCCVGRLYANSNLVIYPALAEGYGMPIVEALQFSKQVLVHNEEPMKSLVRSNRLSSVDTLNPQAFADKIIDLIRKPYKINGDELNYLPSWDNASELLTSILKVK